MSRTCETCKGPFLAHASEVHRGKARFCSQRCFVLTPVERFWRDTDKNGPVPPHVPELGPCWIWKGYAEASGHGRLTIGREQREGAHRLAYELLVGTIPAGLFVCHKCDNPGCVNPTHLFLGSAIDNMTDRDAKGRHCFGSRSPNTHLTESDVAELRALYATGTHSQTALAARFGLGQSAVSSIVRRKSWRHVT